MYIYILYNPPFIQIIMIPILNAIGPGLSTSGNLFCDWTADDVESFTSNWIFNKFTLL